MLIRFLAIVKRRDVFQSGTAQAQYRQIGTLMKLHFLVIGK